MMTTDDDDVYNEANFAFCVTSLSSSFRIVELDIWKRVCVCVYVWI